MFERLPGFKLYKLYINAQFGGN